MKNILFMNYAMKEITIPDNAVFEDTFIFYACDKLEKITASFHTISTLQDMAIYKCPSLKTAVIDGIAYPLRGKFDRKDVYEIAKKCAKNGSKEAAQYLKEFTEPSKK